MTRRKPTAWDWVTLIAVCAFSGAWLNNFATAAPATALPPLQQCEVERVALQAQVVELRAQLVAAQTALDRQAIAAEKARVEGTLPTVDGQRWDWGTLRFVPAQ